MTLRDDDLHSMLERRSGEVRPNGLLEFARGIPDRTVQRRANRGLRRWVARPALVLATVTPIVAMLALVAVVVSLAPSRSPDPAASLPLAQPSMEPTASMSVVPPPADAQDGTIELEVRLSGGAMYTEGFFSYLRIDGPAGPSVIKLEDQFKPAPTGARPHEIEIRGGTGTATAVLAPGAYSLDSYQRPCEAACPPGGVLDEPRDVCTAMINVAAGDLISVMVTVHPGVGCTIDLARAAGANADRPVVLCEAGLIGVARIRPECHRAIHEAVSLARPLPVVATAVARLVVCPDAMDCPPVPDGAPLRERVAWQVHFVPADGGPPQDVLVPAGQWEGFSYGGPQLINEPWEGPYNDTKVGATPQPSPDPSARSLGKPLRIDRLEIPLDHTGRWTVDLGEIALPNGYHTETTFRVPNGNDGTYRAGLISVDLVPLDPDAPGWDEAHRRLIDGPERFRAVLTFDLESYVPGAVMEIAELLVE